MKSFIDAINDSRTSSIMDPVAPLDNLAMFMPEAKSVLKGKQTNFGQSLNCNGHSKVFVLWRPWTQCQRCLKSIELGEADLPEVGDHECPHTMRDAYEQLLDEGLRGDVLFQTQEYFTLHDGTRCCHSVWLTTDSTVSTLAAKRQEVAETFTPLHSSIIAEQKAEAAKKEALEASVYVEPR
jgi:hypothetical protein